MARSDYPDHAFLPAILTTEEISNPYCIISELFSKYHLPEIRTDLHSMLNYLVTGTYPRGTTKSERYDMVFLFRNLEKLVEAAHIIYNEQQKKK